VERVVEGMAGVGMEVVAMVGGGLGEVGRCWGKVVLEVREAEEVGYHGREAEVVGCKMMKAPQCVNGIHSGGGGSEW
jgi:hypothetical protein